MTIADELDVKDQELVAELVKSGRYPSTEAVIREGLRLVRSQEQELAALDAAIARGLADSDAGRSKPMDEVFDRLEAKYRAMADAQGL